MFRIVFGSLWKTAVLAQLTALMALVVVEPGNAGPPKFTVRQLTVTPATTQYNLDQINKYRANAKVAPLRLDPQMNDFATAGSQQLMRDHKPHRHDRDNGPGGGAGRYWETQGYQNGTPIVGWPGAPNVNATIDQILASMMAEPLPPPGSYNHHSIITDPKHTSLGVGLVIDSVNGLLYLTNDFNP